jgi:hypothetical protein
MRDALLRAIVVTSEQIHGVGEWALSQMSAGENIYITRQLKFGC